MGSVIQCLVFKKGCTPIKCETSKSFFDLQAKDLDGNVVHFSQFKDKKLIMVVNVACKCGLTAHNYKQMVAIDNQLSGQGLQILAFPSGQFMDQEFKTEEEIKEYVKQNFDAKFPIFSKAVINGENPHPVYAFLRTHSELFNNQTGQAKVIPWNFAKFLVDRNGEVLLFAEPTTTPNDLKPFILDQLAK